MSIKSIREQNRKEFEEKFGNRLMAWGDISNMVLIKSFLSASEQSLIQGVVETIEGMYKNTDVKYPKGSQAEANLFGDGQYNQALSDLKANLLKELNHE